MKTFIFFLLLIFFSISILHAQNSRLVATSDYNYTNNNFKVADSSVFMYTGNNGGDLTHALKYTTDLTYTFNKGANNPSNYSLGQLSFDANDNISLNLAQRWDTLAAKWVNFRQLHYDYDANNNDTLATAQSYNPVSMKWFYTGEDRISYFNNLQDTLIFLAYDTTANQWNNSTRYCYTFTGNNITQGLIQLWDKANAGWKNNYLYFNYYDSQNNDTSSIFQNYDTTGTILTNDYKKVSSFGNANNLLRLYQLDWDMVKNSFSDTGNATLYYYDANDNDTSFLVQYKSGNTWSDVSYTSFHYNNLNQRTYEEVLNPGGLGLAPVTETFYYYETFNGINAPSGLTGIVQLYPNPSGNYIHCSVTLPQEETIQLSLYNLTGQQLWTTDMGKAARVEATVPVNNLPGGIYILKVNAGGILQQQQVVVAR